jgi:hypothetical protein
MQTLAMRSGSFAEVRDQAKLGHEEAGQIGSQNPADASQIGLDRSQGYFAQME